MLTVPSVDKGVTEPRRLRETRSPSRAGLLGPVPMRHRPRPVTWGESLCLSVLASQIQIEEWSSLGGVRGDLEGSADLERGPATGKAPEPGPQLATTGGQFFRGAAPHGTQHAAPTARPSTWTSVGQAAFLVTFYRNTRVAQKAVFFFKKI